jgi:hypothetical protein
MKHKLAAAVAVVVGLTASTATMAADFAEQMSNCLEKHANLHDKANILLECEAAGGKLTNCKVVENSAAGKGFDKAAICIADAMPMPGKTGAIRVPFRFPGDA